jgi:hypothetical protein
MRKTSTVLTAALALALVAPAAEADVIYSRTGPGDAGFADLFTAASWQQTSTWTDVSVSLEVYNYGAVGFSTSAMVYLLDSLGPGTTQAANELAAAVITSNTQGAQTVTPFTGLTLGPGTYYLGYLRAGGAMWDFDTLLAWFANTSGTATTTAALDVTPAGAYSSGVIAAYQPATDVVPSSATYQLFTIEGTPSAVPEPATLALMIGGAAGLALRARGRGSRP